MFEHALLWSVTSWLFTKCYCVNMSVCSFVNTLFFCLALVTDCFLCKESTCYLWPWHSTLSVCIVNSDQIECGHSRGGVECGGRGSDGGEWPGHSRHGNRFRRYSMYWMSIVQDTECLFSDLFGIWIDDHVFHPVQIECILQWAIDVISDASISIWARAWFLERQFIDFWDSLQCTIWLFFIF